MASGRVAGTARWSGGTPHISDRDKFSQGDPGVIYPYSSKNTARPFVIRNTLAFILVSEIGVMCAPASVLADPESSEAVINQLYMDLYGRNVDGAHERCKKVLLDDPSNAPIAYIAAFLYSRVEGNDQTALELLDRALAAGAQSRYFAAGGWGTVRLQTLKANLLAKLGRTDDALACFQSADSFGSPMTAEDLAVWAGVLMQRSETDKAMVILDDAVERSRVCTRANQLRLKIQVLRGNLPEAVDGFRRFIFVDALGGLLPRVTRLAKLSDGLARDYRSKGVSNELWIKLGDLLVSGGAFSAAEHAYEKAGATAEGKKNSAASLQRLIEDLVGVYHEHYRDIFHRRDDVGKTYARAATVLARWDGIDPPAEETMTHEQFSAFINPIKAKLEKKHRLYMTMGKTQGLDSLHFGFMLSAEPVQVIHWGQTARLEHVVLSPIYDNSCGAWIVNNDNVVPGWNTGGNQIYHVLVASITDALEVAGATKRFETKKSVKAWWEKQTAYKPTEGVKWTDLTENRKSNLRLQVAEMKHFSSQARARGLDLTTYILRSKFQTDIVTHEGQHAIDSGRPGSHSSQDLEYRAKLAELAYGASPYSSLKQFANAFGGSILQKLLAHGKADTTLMKRIVEVLAGDDELNKRLDRTIPLCLQLGELTPEEVVKLAHKVYAQYPDWKVKPRAGE